MSRSSASTDDKSNYPKKLDPDELAMLIELHQVVIGRDTALRVAQAELQLAQAKFTAVVRQVLAHHRCFHDDEIDERTGTIRPKVKP